MTTSMPSGRTAAEAFTAASPDVTATSLLPGAVRAEVSSIP
jgi:hypothetical protein